MIVVRHGDEYDWCEERNYCGPLQEWTRPTYTVMLNPEIIKKDGAHNTEEGCFSFLGCPHPCKRYKSIKVKYQTLELQIRIKTYTFMIS